ncbi:MAG: LTA synthase family protein [Bacilli bacterium]|nr:LTA synthase family protein [Bacilli bacterium]
MKFKKINLILFYFLSLLFCELVFKVNVFGFNSIFRVDAIYTILFITPISILLSLITKLIKKGYKVFFLIILCIICLIYSTEVVFKSILNTFFTIRIVAITDQAAQFADTAIIEIIKKIYLILLMFFPFIIALLFKDDINYKVTKKSYYVLMILFFILTSLIFRNSLYLNQNEENSSYKLFYEIENNALNLEKLGVMPSLYLDVKRIIFGFEEKITIEPVIEVKEEEEIIYEYNNVDIDFEALINKEKNEVVKSMHRYFSSDSGTLKNEYTGLYEGKNLIVVMAESLSPFSISEKYTPTLYKLANSSFIFENFYTPNNLSTIGGEFQELTGLFADLNSLSNYWRKGNNYFPYGIGTLFKNIGYSNYAYHPNWGLFQDRNKYLAKMGFNYFLHRGNGLNKLMNCNKWPQSDLEMVSVTTNQFITKEPFLVYYVSVSGHMPWGFNENSMSIKNKHLVSDLDMSSEAKAYVAANIELDRALRLLIERLETAGILDDTVIALVSDHYPYSMKQSTVTELAGTYLDPIIDINKNTLIIWNSQTEDTHISKTASQLDFMPTLYNLFGIEYDSRLFVGKDILSTEPGLVFFTNRSWVTDAGKYYASSGTFKKNNDVVLEDGYISKINEIVSNKTSISKSILKNDYYRKVFNK